MNFNRVIDAMARGKVVTPDMLRGDDPDIMNMSTKTTKGRTMAYPREIVRPCPCNCTHPCGCGHRGCQAR